MTRREKKYEKQKMVIAKMIYYLPYEKDISVEWLDLASGTRDIEMTKEIVKDLENHPIRFRHDKRLNKLVAIN